MYAPLICATALNTQHRRYRILCYSPALRIRGEVENSDEPTHSLQQTPSRIVNESSTALMKQLDCGPTKSVRLSFLSVRQPMKRS